MRRSQRIIKANYNSNLCALASVTTSLLIVSICNAKEHSLCKQNKLESCSASLMQPAKHTHTHTFETFESRSIRGASIASECSQQAAICHWRLQSVHVFLCSFCLAFCRSSLLLLLLVFLSNSASSSSSRRSSITNNKTHTQNISGGRRWSCKFCRSKH